MTLGLFEGYGIELEYMIVDGELNVAPIADRLLLVDGEVEAEVEHGDIAWSNELVAHVIELKTNGPAPSLGGLAAKFQANLDVINGALDEHGARIMPTAMHPWMDPARETKLWPHEYNAVYALFDRIFGCRGHGWSNLQSMHINLPYAGDDELRRLHTAIRVVLPLLPGLAAASPVVDGAASGWLDSRLEHYRHNCRKLPMVTGHVIPEQIDGEASYQQRILEPIAAAVAPFDDEEILDPEWVNARGAIVRFVRDAVEIRVIDVQEQPAADLAIAELTVAVVRALVEERWSGYAVQSVLDETELEIALLAAIRDGEAARLEHPGLLACLGRSEPCTLQTLWQGLASELGVGGAALELILERGTLARRILTALERDSLRDVYGALCDCTRAGRSFVP